MLARLAGRDPAGTVTAVLGDMVDDLPDGPFDVVLVAYNSLFNLETAERQQACFAAVAAAPRARRRVRRRGLRARGPAALGHRRRRALDVRRTRSCCRSPSTTPTQQRAHGHFVSFVDGERVRLRPWAVRYAPPAELDAMAAAAGLVVAERWEDFDRHPFEDTSPRHVTVYALSR